MDKVVRMEDSTLILVAVLTAALFLGFGHGGLMGFNSLFWIILLAILYLVLNGKENPIRVKEEDSIETLKRRYAEGEITREDYFKIKKDIVED